MLPDHPAKLAYYRAALATLRFVEQRRPTDRRFGPNADARWNAFRGHLETTDRLDLLIRDADAQWPGALGGRTVFALRAVAEDDAFGAEWESLEPVAAERLWREGLQGTAPAGVAGAVEATAAAWQLGLTDFDVESLQAADRIVACGPSAIAATIAAFAQGSDLDWSDQVACVATPPGHRQLAASAVALLNATKRGALVATEGPPSGIDAAALAGRRLIVSEDATAEDAALARQLVEG